MYIETNTDPINSNEVLLLYKEWLEKAVIQSCGTPGNGHPYLIKCLDKLNDLMNNNVGNQKVELNCNGTELNEE